MKITLILILFTTIFENLKSQPIIGEYTNNSDEYLIFSKDTVSFKILKDTVFTSYFIYKGKYSVKNNTLKLYKNLVDFYSIKQVPSVDGKCSICFLYPEKPAKFSVVIFSKSSILKQYEYYTDEFGCIELQFKKQSLCRNSLFQFKLQDISSDTHFEILIEPNNSYVISLFSSESLDNLTNELNLKLLEYSDSSISIKNLNTNKISRLNNKIN